MGVHSSKDNKRSSKSAASVLDALTGSESAVRINDIIVCAVCLVLCIAFSRIKTEAAPRMLILALYFVLYAISALGMAKKSIVSVMKGQLFTPELVLLVSTLISLVAGRYTHAVLAVLLYRAATIGYAYLNSKYEDALGAIGNSIPSKVRLRDGDELREVAPRAVEQDDIILVNSGETIPLDGIIISGMTSVSMSKLGGNSTEITVPKDGFVCAGCINLGPAIDIQVTSDYSDTFAAHITDTISHAHMSPSLYERIAELFSKYFPIVVFTAAIIAAVSNGVKSGEWLNAVALGAAVAAVGTTGCIGISIPMAVSCCVANLSRKGVIIKKNCFVQDLAETGTAVFCKNGIITDGKYQVYDIIPENGVNPEKLLSIAVTAYRKSDSAVAAALRSTGKGIELDDKDFEIIETAPNKGIHVKIGKSDVLVGTADFLKENGVSLVIYDKPGMLLLCVGIDGRFKGQITMADKVRKGSFEMIDTLHLHGISNIVMLTHDEARVAKQTAASLNFDLVKFELDKQGKLEALNYLMDNKPPRSAFSFLRDKAPRSALAFFGYYKKDAELMQTADIGVSIKTFGSDAAFEISDVSILGDDISKVGMLMSAAANCRLIVYINAAVTVLAKLLLVVLTLLSKLNIFTAVLIDTAVFCFTLLNAAGELRDFDRK